MIIYMISHKIRIWILKKSQSLCYLIKKFLIELKTNKTFLDEVSSAATANEIALIASHYGFQFTGKELKEVSKSKIEGVNIKIQDTTPSYNFGEEGN